MCTFGKPIGTNNIRSVLTTADGRREWSSCPQGLITFVPSGFPMEWEWNYQSESIHLTMLPSFVETVGDELRKQTGDCPELRPHFRIFDDSLRSLLHKLRDEGNKNELGKDLVTSSLLRLIVAHLYRLSSSSLPEFEPVEDSAALSASDFRKSVEILNDRLHEKFSLSELAAEFDKSPFHFARVFKRATGFPPHEYQLQLRIARARKMLREKPGRTIAEIACDLGFSDESHFRRHFKRIVGTTPSKFRSRQ